jgi:hypothetical protein
MTVLTRWDPLRDLATLQNRLNRFVRESYSPQGPEEAAAPHRANPRSAHCEVISEIGDWRMLPVCF